MKIIKKFLFIISVIFLFGCTYSSNNPIKLSFDEIYIQVNEVIKLDVSSSLDVDIYFTSKNNDVAIVDQYGYIEGINEGTTKVIVSQGDYEKTCLVHVGNKEPNEIYILSLDDLNLRYGNDKVSFNAIFDSLVSSNVKVDWYINNELYFKESNSLDFYPNIIGDFDIYAKFKDIQSNTLHFTVNKAKLSISADNKEINYLDEDVELTYSINEGNLCYEDKIVGKLTREEGNNAGEYIISQGSLDIVNKEGLSVIDKYDFVFTEGVYKINKITQQEIKSEDVNLNTSSTTITIISEIENLEYSLDGKVWQDNNKFMNLEPNTDYDVFVRIKETINHISSGVLELKTHTLNQYSVNMYAINGNPKDEQYIIYDTLIYDEGDKVDITLTYPEVEGYTFTNYRFILDNEDIIDQNEIHLEEINQNINVYALYDINIYKVKFISQDSEVEYNFKYLDQIVFPEAGIKLGYIFTNWTNENDEIIDSSLLVKNNLILTANYELKNFMVIFYQSSQMVHSEVVAAYDKLTYMPENPSQTGYKFIGWNTKLDGSGTYYYSLQDLTKIKENLYLFAVYEIIQYKVTYLDFDGTLLNEELVDYGNRALYDVVPNREGYIFIGWSKSLDNITGDIEVTALYQEI